VAYRFRRLLRPEGTELSGVDLNHYCHREDDAMPAISSKPDTTAQPLTQSFGAASASQKDTGKNPTADDLKNSRTPNDDAPEERIVQSNR